MEQSKKRILIIDDEPATTRLLRLYLELNGKYSVREENRSANAVTAAHEFQPDLILLDVIMPGLDGGDVMSRLKTDPKLKSVPVVFLTATVRKSDVAAANGIIGGFPFLGKPATADEVIACIEQYCGEQGEK